MNGVSHMLPFVIGGGILIALAFLVDNQAINPANFSKNTPLATLLKTIGEQAFGFMLPILLFPVCGILIMGVVMIVVNPVIGMIVMSFTKKPLNK